MHICLSVYYSTAAFRGTAGYCLWCCADYIAELQLVDLSLLHCVASALCSIVSLVHQYATSACVILWPGTVWGICDWRGTLQTGGQWGRRKWGEKEASKCLCIQWLGYSRQHCQHFPQKSYRKPWEVVGEIFWCILYQSVCVRSCVCICVCTLITLIISSNYLQTANEFLRNPIMLCMCSHHHPFCTAAINLLINKYN